MAVHFCRQLNVIVDDIVVVVVVVVVDDFLCAEGGGDSGTFLSFSPFYFDGGL